MTTKLPIMTFENVNELRTWLEHNHASSAGILVRIYKKGSGISSVTFEDVLDEGLCFGWSESQRLKGDETSYLQKFTPRQRKGTTSERNRQHARQLIQSGRMTPHGLAMLDLLSIDISFQVDSSLVAPTLLTTPRMSKTSLKRDRVLP